MRLKVFKNLKLMLSFTMVSIILLNCAGCKIFAENEQASALEYLEERYPDDEFELISTYGGGAGIDGHTYIFSSKNYPENKVHVLSDGDSFIDSYISIKYKSETTEKIDDILTKIMGSDHVLIVSCDTVYCRENPEISFEDYLNNSDVQLIIITNYAITPDECDSFSERLKTEFRKNDITTLTSTIYFDKGTKEYDDAKKSNSNKNYDPSQNAYYYCVFRAEEKEDDFYIRWGEID